MKKKTKLIIAALLATLVGTATLSYSKPAKQYGEGAVKNLISVYDGDTFKANLYGFPPIVGDTVSIRILGIDTPEIRGSSPDNKVLAIKAREMARRMLEEAHIIKLKNMQRGKYFRILANVYADTINVGDSLIRGGLAKPYDGGTKSQW